MGLLVGLYLYFVSCLGRLDLERKALYCVLSGRGRKLLFLNHAL